MTGPGSRAPTARGAARAEPLDQLAHRQRREVHDRGGLAVVAALDPVDALDRRRVERIAGEPVEAVGGEDGDPAGGDAALQRRSRRIGAARLTETTSVMARCSPLPSDSPLRSLLPSPDHAPARSRRGRGGCGSSAKPAPRSSSATAPACPSPTSRASVPCRHPAGSAARIAIEAVGAGEQRLARLPLRSSPAAARPSRARRRRGGWRGSGRRPPPPGQIPARKSDPPAEAEALGVGARHLQRRGRGVGRGHLAAPAAPSAIASAIAPEPVPTSSSRAGPQLQRQFDQQLGLRARDQHPAVDRRARSGGSPCGRGCRRPARAAAAAAPSPRSAARHRPAPRRSGSAASRARVAPGRLGEEQFGVEARARDPGRAERIGRGPDRLANAARGGRRRHAHQAADAAASSLLALLLGGERVGELARARRRAPRRGCARCA